MVQWYLLCTGLGLNYAINVELSTQQEISEAKSSEKISTAVILTAVIGFTLILVGTIVTTSNIHIFDKYLFYKYALILGCITCTNLIQQLLINVYRYYKKLFRIAFVELFGAIIILLIALTYRKLELLNAVLLGLLGVGVVSIIVLLVRAPFKISFKVDFREARSLLKVGVPLLIYNVSYVMMTIISQTIISIFYSVEMMGYYTLANNIAMVILLGLNSISWIIYPDILHRTRAGLNNSEVMQTLGRITEVYSITVFITVYVSIIIIPLLYLILPQYKLTHEIIVILLLSQVVLSYCFGYNCLAVARKKQLIVATQSTIAVVIVAVLSLVVVLMKLSYVWIATAVLFGSYIFNILQAKAGNRIIENRNGSLASGINNIPFGNMLAIIVCLFGSLSGYQSIGAFSSFMLFIYLNKEKIVRTYAFCSARIKSGTVGLNTH
jgi:O-antigen/teichoic acid export membrane protein